jgi:hypothetical protein
LGCDVCDIRSKGPPARRGSFICLALGTIVHIFFVVLTPGSIRDRKSAIAMLNQGVGEFEVTGRLQFATVLGPAHLLGFSNDQPHSPVDSVRPNGEEKAPFGQSFG